MESEPKTQVPNVRTWMIKNTEIEFDRLKILKIVFDGLKVLKIEGLYLCSMLTEWKEWNQEWKQ